MNEGLYLKRSIEEVILEASQYFSVLSVTGPRQSGEQVLANTVSVDQYFDELISLVHRDYANL